MPASAVPRLLASTVASSGVGGRLTACETFHKRRGWSAVSSFDDPDWVHERPDDGTLLWKIAAGVAIGIVVAAVVLYAIVNYRAQVAVEELTRSLQQVSRSVSESSERASRERQRQEADRAALEQDARQRQAEQLRVTAEAALRKERAWAKFYRKPPNCEGNPNNDQLVECANQFIRAKRQFEEAYAAGKL